MRAVRWLFCAVALTACLAPGVRADEYTKQTFLTFSGPVQLPGMTLPAGTYQFRLADPDSGRRTLQVWDKEGTKLYSTLLTIPDQRMTPTDKPVVMFTEAVSGEPQPIRSWFYPNETYGMEFVYPKDQAMRIAKATHSSVLSFDDDSKKDEAAYKSAKVGRVDEHGQMTDADKADTMASNTGSSHQAQSASTTTSSAASTTTASDNTSAQQQSSSNASSQTAQAQDRAPAQTAVGTSGTTAPAATDTSSEANRDNIPSNRATGTSGTFGTANTNAQNSQNSATQSGASASGTQRSTGDQSNASAAGTAGSQGAARTLPRTASSVTLIQVLAGLALMGAVAARLFRMRLAQMR